METAQLETTWVSKGETELIRTVNQIEFLICKTGIMEDFHMKRGLRQTPSSQASMFGKTYLLTSRRYWCV